MKKSKTNNNHLLMLIAGSLLLLSCTKYQQGFISPTMRYSVSTFSVVKGRVASSNSLVSDGSAIPLTVKWTHIYDSSGNVADTLFSQKHAVGIWTTPYNPLTDTTYAKIIAKRSTADLTPIVVNPKSGVIEANPGTYHVPSGTYTMDLEVTNIAGRQELNNAMTILITEGRGLETSPEQGTYSLGRLFANTASGPANNLIFNGNNNPFVVEKVTRFADTPDVVIVRVTDRHGQVFNPAKGEVAKRPNSGLNPMPPFLQNLQDYAPDTYKALDTAMLIKFPLVPFPIVSLGNGFNMYYRIPSRFVHIDSTSTWPANVGGGYYQDKADPHYLGSFKDDLYDFSIRIPMRVQVPGSYLIDLKILNITHR